MDHKVTFIVIPSSKDYKPIRIDVGIPEELARLLMATPVGAVSIGVSVRGLELDKTPLLDYKY
ncbi:hypothetical protein ES703_104951 [subsurface metagenome]